MNWIFLFVRGFFGCFVVPFFGGVWGGVCSFYFLLFSFGFFFKKILPDPIRYYHRARDLHRKDQVNWKLGKQEKDKIWKNGRRAAL